MKTIEPGTYRHYKGPLYEVIDTVRHSEIEEWLVLYRSLYGERKLWVRPFDMFVETVEVNGKSVARFAPEREDQDSLLCRPASLDDIAEVLAAIPELHNTNWAESIEERTSGKNYLALIAYLDDRPVGCKFGYALDTKIFYSWLGGVLPGHRGKGIAQQLLRKQEAWAKQTGFQHVQVKTMNRFPAMLNMLIKNGYQVRGYDDKGTVEASKIRFTKKLV